MQTHINIFVFFYQNGLIVDTEIFPALDMNMDGKMKVLFLCSSKSVFVTSVAVRVRECFVIENSCCCFWFKQRILDFCRKIYSCFRTPRKFSSVQRLTGWSRWKRDKLESRERWMLLQKCGAWHGQDSNYFQHFLHVLRQLRLHVGSDVHGWRIGLTCFPKKYDKKRNSEICTYWQLFSRT